MFFMLSHSLRVQRYHHTKNRFQPAQAVELQIVPNGKIQL
jgi:hypothetical protein